MFFIVSTGRSGTKTIAQTLNQLEAITCIHEPEPLLAIEASAYRYGNISKDEIAEILVETRKPRLNGEIYCESNQALSLIIPVLIETFPEASFIWLLRNGLDVVASAMQKQWYTGHSENYDRFEDAPQVQQTWIKARLNGYKCGEFSKERWGEISRFEKSCWYWDYVNRTIEADLNKYKQTEYFVINLENIQTQLPNLLSWMGVNSNVKPDILTINKAKRPPYHWKRWTDDEKLAFQARCGSLMSKYYPEWTNNEGNWQGVSYEIEPSRNYFTYLVELAKRWMRNLRGKFKKSV